MAYSTKADSAKPSGPQRRAARYQASPTGKSLTVSLEVTFRCAGLRCPCSVPVARMFGSTCIRCQANVIQMAPSFVRMHEQGLSDAQRDAAPLFSSEPGVAFFRSAIDAALRDALLCFVSADRASTYSFHSWRIRLACKLRAAGCDNPTIQALVRWNTDRAIALYARYEREDYWSILQRAGRHDATSVQFTALPELDESHRILEKLGLTGQPWSAVEQHLRRLLGAPAQREQPPLPPPPPTPSPAAAASATQASSAAPSGLPPGYAMQIRQAKSRSYKVYRGPHGMVQSLPAAWRQYNKQAPQPR